MMMLERSESARYAKAKFFEGFNDVDIFVEDTAEESKKIYCELLSRALNNQLGIAQVFPLGPKDSVIKRCAADQGERARPAVYIIDGDYDFLSGVSIPPLKRLYRHERYSIENYLCDGDAIVAVISDESVKEDFAASKLTYDFSGWALRAAPPLYELTLACVIAHLTNCGLPSVNIPLASIRGSHGDHVDEVKVKNLIATYVTAIDAKLGAGSYERLRLDILKRSSFDHQKFVTFFTPAKAVLMPLLTARIIRKSKMTMSKALLKCKLAKRCDVADFASIGKFIA
jgi:hypothetical protein